jgi:cellulose synthase/poly-beta-1,6-N-acetylglucosamine synthase-like glycosyltransferase
VQLTEILVIMGLIETLILFCYALRYYIFSLTVLFFRNREREEPVISDQAVGQFISVMLPVYNEPNVVDRLLKSCTSFDYPSYEVLVLDDSTDETTAKLEKWKTHPRVKVIHRNSRTGWKGGALNEGLEHLDARSTHVLILDADFVPPADLLKRFLARYGDGETVAVQGYQNHDLNAEENWLTKGVRVLYCVDNMVELSAKNKLKLFNYLTGSVFMIKTEILKRFRFEDDLTEDWNLTLRLYEAAIRSLTIQL